jgi:hypothetical protein
VIRKIRGSGDPGRVLDAESERRIIYARRENLPMRTRSEAPGRSEEKKGRASRLRTG